MDEVELWGWRPGAPIGTVPDDLIVTIHELMRKYGREAVVQVATLESQILIVKR